MFSQPARPGQGASSSRRRSNHLARRRGARKAGRTLVEVDPRYFRPTEVDLLVGDPTKARQELGWHHNISLYRSRRWLPKWCTPISARCGKPAPAPNRHVPCEWCVDRAPYYRSCQQAGLRRRTHRNGGLGDRPPAWPGRLRGSNSQPPRSRSHRQGATARWIAAAHPDGSSWRVGGIVVNSSYPIVPRG